MVKKNKSTATASQSFIESIQEALDCGLHVIYQKHMT
jgi:hypothetical protein